MNLQALSYKEYGEGKPVVILHGLFGSSDNWVSIAKSLSNGWKIYLPDLRNHGDSFHSEEFDYKAMAGDIKRFLKNHKIEDPIIIGHSMGGKTAMKFAVTWPDLLHKLVVVDIGPKRYPVRHQKIIDGLKSIPIDKISSRKKADDYLSEHIKEKSIRQFLLKNLDRDNKKGYKWKMNLSVIDEKIENVGKSLEKDARFDGQTLFIYGENSDYIQDDDKSDIREIFPTALFLKFKDTGHWVHAEKPDEFIKAINRFLK